MAHHNTVFSQLLNHIPKSKFKAHVDRENGDKHCRRFFCWDLFVVMLFGQLTQAKSLRDLVEKLSVQQSRWYHLGLKSAKRSTISDAVQKRSVWIFYRVFFDLLGQLGKQSNTSHIRQAVQLIDSTVVTMCMTKFKWASYRTGIAGIKIHTLYDPDLDAPIFFTMSSGKLSDCKAVKDWGVTKNTMYVFDRAYSSAEHLRKIIDGKAQFVGRMKKCMKYRVLSVRTPQGEGVLQDEYIEVIQKTQTHLRGIALRRIEYLRQEDGKLLAFFTNDFERSAEEIAALYKRRWQIELFFKWIKQHLKVKQFYGTSENAVLLQVIIAMISYVLMRLVQEKYDSKITNLQFSQRLATAILQRVVLSDLLKKTPDEVPKPEDFGLVQLALE